MRGLLYLFFFCSGFCGLIYEVLWTRLFVMVMGGTVYSFTTVLVAFMSGLALGGWLGGRYADRMKRNPLMVYGILEGLIGFYCLFIPSLINLLNPVFDAIYPFLVQHNLAGLLMRFFFSSLLLIIPTTMMGATLPILVRYQYESQKHIGRTTGLLYGLNTFGAVFGSFVSGMILIPELGQRSTLYVSAGINFLIFISILGLSQTRKDALAPRRSELDKTDLPGPLNLRSALVLLGYALSGGVAMIYQVSWTRALILSLGTTLYVLSLILTAYIAGLALGAVAITPFADRIKRLYLFIGLIEFGIGISAWAVVPLLARLPIWMILIHHPETYYRWLSIEFGIGVALIFLPTFMMGGLLPLVVRVYARSRGGVGDAVGDVYAWNTIGAILGSFVCGFFLIAWLGLRDSLSLACILSLLIGTGFVFAEKIPKPVRAGAVPVVALLIFLFSYFQPGWSPEIINSGPYIYFNDYSRQGAQGRKAILENLKSMNRTLFHKEGVEATVSVFESPEHTLALRINGKTDASTGVDMTTQVLTGHLPLLLHKSPEKIAIIGLASGVTLGSSLTHPIESAVCLEISPEVVEASRYFNSVNRRPLDDPRTRLVIDDGRYFLRHTPEKYDVIISEPSNPWISGMGLLFTKEFFSLARSKLNPGGIMLIWIGVYDLDLESVRMIVRTFLKEFPQATLWESIPGGDYLLVGFRDEMELDYSRLKLKMRDPRVNSDLARINLQYPERLIARFLMGPAQLKLFANGGPVHIDDLRQLELGVPKSRYENFEQNLGPILKAFLKWRESPTNYLKFSFPSDAQDLSGISRFYQGRVWVMEAHLAMMNKELARVALEKLLMANELEPEDRWVRDNLYFAYHFQGQHDLRHGNFSQAVLNLSKSWEYNPKGSEIPGLASFYYFQSGDLVRAGEWVARALETNQKDALAWMIRAELELKQGKPELAVNSFERAKQNWQSLVRAKDRSAIIRAVWQANPEDLSAKMFCHSGEANLQTGNFQQALADFEHALSISPDYIPALVGAGRTYLELNELDRAREKLSRAIKLSPKNALAHFYLGKTLARLPEYKKTAIAEFNIFLKLAEQNLPERKEAEKILKELKVVQ